MRLLSALRQEPLDRPPVWLMRQAGRYLPEYRELRARHGFEGMMRDPAIAAEVSLQPLRRFPLDAAIVFADIMTPLQGLGVPVRFDPGPVLDPLEIGDVARLGEFRAEVARPVGEAISTIRSEVGPEVAVIGFAGGPATVLAYLLEGGGSQQHPRFRSALHGHETGPALEALALMTRRYLEIQIEAGADVVQLFDTWVGLLSREQFEELVVPAVRQVLTDLAVPSIYFAPAASHLLDRVHLVGATGYGVDWRQTLPEAWDRIGDHPVQGNLDPSVLLAGPEATRSATRRLLEDVEGRPGHVLNLGHGVLPGTPPESVAAMVEVATAGQALEEAR